MEAIAIGIGSRKKILIFTNLNISSIRYSSRSESVDAISKHLPITLMINYLSIRHSYYKAILRTSCSWYTWIRGTFKHTDLNLHAKIELTIEID